MRAWSMVNLKFLAAVTVMTASSVALALLLRVFSGDHPLVLVAAWLTTGVIALVIWLVRKH